MKSIDKLSQVLELTVCACPPFAEYEDGHGRGIMFVFFCVVVNLISIGKFRVILSLTNPALISGDVMPAIYVASFGKLYRGGNLNE
ncbi:MAG: hypothetical protein HY865_25260 [Chloroflexi bacterium]|nr:hypothetical protein [Chloroflexota bacterium]